MIVKEIFHGVKCNRCGEIYNDTEDHSYFHDESNAVECALDDDWIERNGKHYCPGCFITDENETVTIKPPHPDYIKKVRNYLHWAAELIISVHEDDGYFIIRGYTKHNTKKIATEDAEWITTYLGDKLVGISYNNAERCSNAEFHIKIRG